MKFILLLFVISTWPAWSRTNVVKKYDILSEELDFSSLNQSLAQELGRETEILRKVKYNLINGDVRLAKTYLTKIASTRSQLKPLIFRYLGMVSFIEGQYADAFRYLSLPELQESANFAKICTLKVLTRIVLSKKDGLSSEWETCQLRNIGKINPTGFLWLQTLIDLKMRPFAGMTSLPFQNTKLARFEVEDLKIFLKLALYLNQENLVLPELDDLTLEQLQNDEVRELVGAIYFRTGSFSRAYKFTKALSSPNSENIKGNLYLLREKYELAYAQFKLALVQKQNSQNAMERLLPLAWLLGDWEAGSSYAERVIATPATHMNKLTILAAFLMQKGEFEKSKKVLDMITRESSKWNLLDVSQVASFVALMQNDRANLIKNSALSCKQDDLVNCWVLYQNFQWDNLPLTLRRDEEIAVEPMWEKLSQTKLDEPLKETVYINQLDIEELDDKLVRLTKDSP